jgi:hypothetical protein
MHLAEENSMTENEGMKKISGIEQYFPENIARSIENARKNPQDRKPRPERTPAVEGEAIDGYSVVEDYLKNTEAHAAVERALSRPEEAVTRSREGR